MAARRRNRARIRALADLLWPGLGLPGSSTSVPSTSFRPRYSGFPIHYHDYYQALLPHLATLKRLVQVVRLRALANLGIGQQERVLRDVLFGLRLANTLKSDGFLISSLVRIANMDLALQPVWEGLARQQWSGSQLLQIQPPLVSIDLLNEYGPAMRTERAAAIGSFDQLRSGNYRDLGKSNDDEDNSNSYLNNRKRFYPRLSSPKM